MGVRPISASRIALEKACMKVNDIDYWKTNEAFCIMALNCIKELGIDPDRVNVMGESQLSDIRWGPWGSIW